MANVIPVRNIPKRYLKIAPQKATRPIRDKETGMFHGRRVSKNGDSTRSQYLIHDYDINHDGKIGKNEQGGTIQGRSSTTVKSSSRAKGYRRRL